MTVVLQLELPTLHICFSGCSITYGDELDDLNDRFSKVVSDRLGIPEVNLSLCGVSNDYIVRSIIDYCENNVVDSVVAQFTIESRMEYFAQDGSHHKFSVQRQKKNVEHCNTMGWWYKFVYNKKHGWENLSKNMFLLETYCKSKSIDYIPLWCDYMGEIESTYWIPDTPPTKIQREIFGEDRVNKVKAPKGHPNKEGHKIIADWLMDNI